MTDEEHTQMLQRWRQEAEREEVEKTEPAKGGQETGRLFLDGGEINKHSRLEEGIDTHATNSVGAPPCKLPFKTDVNDVFDMKNASNDKTGKRNQSSINKLPSDPSRIESSSKPKSPRGNIKTSSQSKSGRQSRKPDKVNLAAATEKMCVPESVVQHYSGGAFPSPRLMAPLSALCPGPPSPLLPYHLANALHCYATLMRRYQGDLASEALEVAECLLGICDALSGDPHSLCSADRAVAAAATATLSLLQCGPAPARDVIALLQLPSVARGYFAYLAFSDLALILKKASAELCKPAQTKPVDGSFLSAFPCSQQKTAIKLANKKSLNAAIRKLEFYLAYLNSSFFKDLDLSQELAMLLFDRS